MIIDFHTHTFPDAIASRAVSHLQSKSHTIPFSDGTNDGLLSAMEASGRVTHSVVLPVATSPKQVENINNSAARLNETYGDRGLLSLGAMHPAYGSWKEELLRIREMGLRGIKIHPVYQGEDLDSPAFLRILACCAEQGLLVVTHTGDDIGFPGEIHCSPQMALHALREITGPSFSPAHDDGAFRLILAHMGGWRHWDEVLSLAPEMLAAGPVMLDTSFSTGHFYPDSSGYWKEEDTGMLAEDAFVRIVRAYGAEHILFGTDSPWSSQEESLRFIDSCNLTENERDLIYYENAAGLLFRGRISPFTSVD